MILYPMQEWIIRCFVPGFSGHLILHHMTRFFNIIDFIIVVDHIEYLKINKVNRLIYIDIVRVACKGSHIRHSYRRHHLINLKYHSFIWCKSYYIIHQKTKNIRVFEIRRITHSASLFTVAVKTLYSIIITLMFARAAVRLGESAISRHWE